MINVQVNAAEIAKVPQKLPKSAAVFLEP